MRATPRELALTEDDDVVMVTVPCRLHWAVSPNLAIRLPFAVAVGLADVISPP